MNYRYGLRLLVVVLIAFLIGRASTSIAGLAVLDSILFSVPADVYKILFGGLITLIVTWFFNTRQRHREDGRLRSAMASEIRYTLNSLRDVRNSLAHGLSGDVELPVYGTDIVLSDDVYLANTAEIGRLDSDESDVLIHHYVLLKRLRLVLNELEKASRSPEYDKSDIEHLDAAARELTISVHSTGEIAIDTLQPTGTEFYKARKRLLECYLLLRRRLGR